jgi:hypothetical protein
MNYREGLKLVGSIFVCTFAGHKTEEIYEDDEEWLKANPDKDCRHRCLRCGEWARLYWSVEANKLKAYIPNMDAGPTNAIFGDIERDGWDIYGDGELPSLHDLETKEPI